MTTFQQEMSKIDLESISYPVNCPYCSTPTVIEDAFPKCPNFQCNGRVFGRVQKYVECLDIKGVGEETIRQLVEVGLVKHPCDLYKVKAEDYCRLDRKGMAHYNKLQDGLKSRRVFDLADFLGALSIQEAAAGTWQHVMKAGFDTIEKILQAKPAELAKAERVTERKALSMQAELRAQLPQVQEMVDGKMVEIREVKTGTKLSGKTVAITGTLSKPRKWFEDAVKSAGGYFASSVTSKTTYLVMADAGSTSAKAQDARSKGVKVIGEVELMEMLNG